MPSNNGLERLGYMLAGATAIVTVVAFLMVQNHIEAAQGRSGPGQLVSSATAASTATH
jgi:hypothetical protein